eukprot:TRINITY_DN78_c0_g1_i1.p1 TRINITY_DN78_c0_g1~~TRINITY_DN78_c0_g1_i1.p1  ORF type:complete len:284 (-),score=63.19 TRINITY_DN78_c0_g1_i1:99-950(-)
MNRAGKARNAYENEDIEESKRVHDHHNAAHEKHKFGGDYVKSIVYGGLDGIITTFAVVSGVAGAGLGIVVVLIMGFSNLVADGISMGVGDYISTSAELSYAKAERRREEWEYDNYIEGEKREMVELFRDRGLSKRDAKKVINILSTNKEHFIDLMMVEELGMMSPDPDESPAKHGVVTFLSFVVFGLVPLLSYLLAYMINPEANFDDLFIVAIILTGVTLFGLGTVTSRFTTESWYKGGFYMFLNGGLAAAASYLIGYMISEIVNVDDTECTDPYTGTMSFSG